MDKWLSLSQKMAEGAEKSSTNVNSVTLTEIAEVEVDFFCLQLHIIINYILKSDHTVESSSQSKENNDDEVVIEASIFIIVLFP